MQTTGPAPAVIGDRRLAGLLARFEAGEVSVLSLDVFDTLVSRVVPEPVDAFPLLGRRLADRGLIRDGLSPESFGELRRTAERRARARHPNRSAPEVTLEQIYAEFRGDAVLLDSPAALADAELAFEKEMTFPDLEIRELARVAVERHGARLAVVSDTYFTEGQLRRFLDRPSLSDLTFDVVLTSSSRRTGKGQSLFRYLVDQLDVEPAQILHVGDHEVSDVASPARFGISTAHFHKFPGDLARVVDREIAVKEGHIFQKRPRLDPSFGDLGLTALRAKSGWQWSPEEVDAETVEYWQFGSTTLGPLMLGFGEWVHDQASKLEVDTLWCLMREGRFLARALNATREHTSSTVEARELWASRRAFAEATIEHGSRREIEPFMWRRHPTQLSTFLETLGVPLDALPAGLAAKAAARLDERDVRQRVLEVVTRDRDVRDHIVEVSAEKRRRLLTYLRATVGDLGRTVALVDLGWGGTIQSLLARAMEVEGLDTSFVGLYLLSGDTAAHRILEGHRSHSWLAEGGAPEQLARWVTRSPEVLEQSCMADVGSLVGFDEDGTPVLGPSDEPELQRRQRRAVQDGSVSFQRTWSRYEPLLPAGAGNLDPRARDHLRAVLLRLVVEPMPSEAALFASWLHDEGFGSSATEAMVAEDLVDMGDHMTPTQFLALPMSRVYWPFGLAALRNRALAAASGSVAAGLVPAGAFSSERSVPVMIEVADGKGQWRRVYTAEVHCNVNGLRFLRWEGLVNATHLRLVFGHEPAVVRLDAARTLAALAGGASSLVRYADAADFAGLEAASGIRLRPNVILGATAPPAVALPVSASGIAAHRVEIEIGFELLATGAPATPARLALEASRKAARRAWRVMARPARRR